MVALGFEKCMCVCVCVYAGGGGGGEGGGGKAFGETGEEKRSSLLS